MRRGNPYPAERISLPYESRFEIGPWFDGGTRIGPEEVMSRLTQSTASLSPYCIYIHIPFCPTRCTYCALYTRAVTKKTDAILDEFLNRVEVAVRKHPNAHPAGTPTTVHFGGGTPLFLGSRRFRYLANLLKETFGDSPACEWALETTTSAMSSSVISFLEELAIRRIHLGVQTLDNRIRKRIRRREPAQAVLEKIRSLINLNFLISVDLILGFEDQTEAALEEDLMLLYEAGIRMFSICELRNLRGGRNTPEIARHNHHLWHILWNFLTSHGLIPIHTGQFGRSCADNLYYTHPARGENCIAIGPYAHGSSGNMIYANKLLRDYYGAIRRNDSPVQFGVIFHEGNARIMEMEKELLGHKIHSSLVQKLRNSSESFCLLWDEWMEKELIVYSEKRKYFHPSCDGSWFVGNMTLQLRELAGRNRKVQ